MSAMRPSLILLHERDNILIARRHIAVGETITIDGREHTAGATVEVGHKVARAALEEGDKVIRFGAPIGSMTLGVSAGDHIHTHNMKSDYIASHSRDAVSLDGGSA